MAEWGRSWLAALAFVRGRSPFCGQDGLVLRAVDRVERHDVLNAIGLAVVLMAMALALVFGARALFNTVNGGLTDSTTADDAVETDTSGTVTTLAGGDTTSTTEEETTTTLAQPRPASEVLVRVGNGARRSGIAAAGTSIVQQAGYPTLGGKNAPSTEASVVYYVDGYEADALQVARLLGIAESQIAPMPADPGIPQGEALLIAILGADTNVG